MRCAALSCLSTPVSATSIVTPGRWIAQAAGVSRAVSTDAWSAFDLQEIHDRSLWQVLGIYLAGSWLVLQVVDTLNSTVGMPEWVIVPQAPGAHR
jgi:hypothetical protein